MRGHLVRVDFKRAPLSGAVVSDKVYRKQTRSEKAIPSLALAGGPPIGDVSL